MSSDRSGDEGEVIDVSSDSDVEERQDDDLFEVRGGPTEEDLKEYGKKEPSPKRSNEPEAVQPTTGEKCSICLQPFDVVTVLSGCYHRFCFACILHWSQVSPTCPLCKRALGYFMYDITADGQYRTFNPKELHSSAPRSRLLEKFPTEAHRRRKAVYTQKLQRISISKKRVPAAATHQPLTSEKAWDQRIEPWVKRELQAILSEEDVALLLLMTRSLVLTHGPTAPELKRKLQDFLFEDTEAFSSELEGFIGSGLNMDVYDRLVEYQSAPCERTPVGQKRRKSDE